MTLLIAVFLVTGIAFIIFSAIGVLVVTEPFARLHFLTPASTLGLPLVSIAVMLEQGHTRVSLKVGIIAALMLVGQPAVTAATGRAIAAARGLAAPEKTR